MKELTYMHVRKKIDSGPCLPRSVCRGTARSGVRPGAASCPETVALEPDDSCRPTLAVFKMLRPMGC
eukprot:scaffold707_cov399-Prasinococcus_capsulatus_cf.AAC.18